MANACRDGSELDMQQMLSVGLSWLLPTGSDHLADRGGAERRGGPGPTSAGYLF